MHENCRDCEYMDTYLSLNDGNSTLSICTVEPIENGADILWLDVDNFDSGECLNFKQG